MRAGLFSAIVASCLSLGGAQAQEWPSRQPIKIIVPFTAGSGTDIVARTVFEQVGRQINQSIVTENRGGAGTTIGSNAVAKASPDGYTVLVNSTSHVVVASTYAKLPYHVIDDFAPVSALADLPFVLAARTRYRTLDDLVQAAKAQPGSLNFGSAGAGSSGQLFIERFRLAAGFEARHVPFRGTPEAMTEIMSDRLDLFPAPVSSAIELARDGKISALAVSSRTRMQSMPDLPTTIELGYPNSDYNFWVGAFLPAKTPADIVKRLHAEIVRALETPHVRKSLSALGGDPMPLAPEAFVRFLRKELEVNAEIVRLSGFKPQ